MSIFSAALRYVKGTLLFPYYSARTYEMVHSLGNKSPNNPDPHAPIYSDCHLKGATINDGILDVAGVKVFIDPPRVVETINEVLVRRDYDFCSASGDYIMIDVGMNVGLAALAHARNAACLHVYAFEPLKPTFDRAVRNIALNPRLASKVTVHNFGLSDRDARISVKFSTHDIMSVSSESTFDACFGDDVTEEDIHLRAASDALRPIFETHGNDRVFLKIDCEGAEFKILPDLAAAGLLERVAVVAVEWHNQDPQKLLDVLCNEGFFCFVNQINVQWNVGLIKAVRNQC